MYARTRELLTKHRADVEKVAQRLLEKEVLTRYVFIMSLISMTDHGYREDMIDLLGKRPFSGKDDMDKWLDEHSTEHKRAPLPIPEPDQPLPDPSVAFKSLNSRT